MAPARLLPLEQLEDRVVPATFNVPWPDAPSLTLSFAPDGTDAGGQPSALFRALDARLPTAVWEGEVLRAFQTWAAVANVNVRVVPDGGEPFGVLGLKQGDPRFGDIRVGAFPMAGDTLAIADPYDPFIANTSVGDVFLNSNVDFSAGGGGGSYDLFSVLLHEAGHVLGIGPSTDPNSPMFEQYHAVTGLTAGDVAAIRALYGPRPAGAPADPVSDSPPAGVPHYNPSPASDGGSDPTNPLAGAVLLATTPGYVEHTYYEAVNSITSAAPAHSYHVLSPDLGDGLANVMTVVVNPLGGGDEPLKANVYDAQGDLVDATVVPDTWGHYTIEVRGVRSAADYYVQVLSADPDGVSGSARYEVAIDFALDGSHLQTFVNDTLDPGTAADARVLQVVESQQFQFVLSASDWGAAAGAGAQMTIFDESGRSVFTLVAGPGAARIGTVFLDAGRYTVEFTRTTGPGDTLTPVLFELSGLSESDSLGPQLRDTTRAPVEASAEASVPSPSFFWLPAGSTVGLPTPPAPSPGVRLADLEGRPAGSGAVIGEGLPQGPRASAEAGLPLIAGALGGTGVVAGDAPPALATMAGLPPVSSSVGAGAVAGAATGESPEPDLAAVPGESTEVMGARAERSAADAVPAADHVTVAAAGPAGTGRLFWALCVGGAALSWMLLRARWCGRLVVEPSRRVSRLAASVPRALGRSARG